MFFGIFDFRHRLLGGFHFRQGLPMPCPFKTGLHLMLRGRIGDLNNSMLLQELGHFLLHAVGLGQGGNAGLTEDLEL